MDPASGGISKAAGELLKEMQQAQTELQKQQPGGATPGQSNFADAMQNQQVHQVQAQTQLDPTQKAAGATASQNVLATAKLNAQNITTRVGETARTERSKLADMLESLVSGQDKMTGIMNMALSGRQFSPPELLAMQAGVYRFTQELELTSKVVEKGTSGIKQTMNTQV